MRRARRGKFLWRCLPARESGILTHRVAFQLAQAFNLFYHHHHILTESDAAKKTFLLQLSRLVEVQLVAALELLGIESPEKM